MVKYKFKGKPHIKTGCKMAWYVGYVKKNKAFVKFIHARKECKPAKIKGREFYTWTGKYCYHIVVGSLLEQGRWSGQKKSLCNKRHFKKSVTIGRGRGISRNYYNGSSKSCPGGKKRSASLKIMSSHKYKKPHALVSEPSTCHYAITVAVPSCKAHAHKKKRKKCPPIKHAAVHCGKPFKTKCIYQNMPIRTLSAAWKKCRQVKGCTRIMKWGRDKKYYLRSAKDKVKRGGRGTYYRNFDPHNHSCRV
jgi:hypothetical protein